MGDPTPEQEERVALIPDADLRNALATAFTERNRLDAECDRLREMLERERIGRQYGTELQILVAEAERKLEFTLAAGWELAEAVEEAHRCLSLIGHVQAKFRRATADEVLMSALARFREAVDEKD